MIQVFPADLTALQSLRELARQYCAVELTLSDCGCHTVSLFVGGVKIVEEDKDLFVCVEAVEKRIGELTHV